MLLTQQSTVVPFPNMSSRLLADIRTKRPAPANLYDFLHEKHELELTDNHFISSDSEPVSMPTFLRVVCKDDTQFCIILHYPKKAGHGDIVGYSAVPNEINENEIDQLMDISQNLGGAASIRDIFPHPIDFSVLN